MENAQTTEAPKTAKKLRAPKATTTETKAKATKPAAKVAAAPKAPKPTAPGHQFTSSYGGPSGPLNNKASRTPVDFSRFGQFTNMPLTERDEACLRDLRKSFGNKQFKRYNMDAGNLRRLGERGCIRHVSGDAVSADATFVLTKKGLGQPEAPAKKVA